MLFFAYVVDNNVCFVKINIYDIITYTFYFESLEGLNPF